MISRYASILLLFVLSYVDPADAETLRDAIISASASNPQIAAARARQDALAESPEQARALGRVTAEIDGNGGYNLLDYGKGGEGSFSVTLPIWTGGRVSAAVKAASHDVAAGVENVRDVQAMVLEAVIQAYAGLLYVQQAVAVASADIILLDHQVVEAQSRFNLGQATRTDVAQLQAQRELAAATLADAQGAADVAAARYQALVGHSPGELDSAPPPVDLPTDLALAKRMASERNPQTLQRRLVAEADAQRVNQQRAERNPTLVLGGTLGYAAGSPEQNGLANKINVASGGLSIRIPILTGGLVSSRIRQAEATVRADQYDVDGAEREALRATEAAWANLTAAVTRSGANDRRAKAAELALKGVRAEYAFSLRTTLDILVADESLRSAQLDLARSRSDVIIAQAALLRATGRLQPEAYL